jgi:hypothetical protein
MPGRGEDMYFSFDMGPVHFVSISTEFYYFLNFGVTQVSAWSSWCSWSTRCCGSTDGWRGTW